MVNVFLLLFFIPEILCHYPPWINSSYHGIPWNVGYFCKDVENIVLMSKARQPQTYYVWINEMLDAGTEVTVQFDAEATLFINSKLDKENNSRFTKEPDTVNNIYTFEFTNRSEKLRELFRVEGNTPHHPIHVISLKINGVEKCHNPDTNIFEQFDMRYRLLSEAPDKQCGRRRINLRNGEDQSFESNIAMAPGSWPWHAALYINDSRMIYTCGGTVISTQLVLTAAHCVTTYGVVISSQKLRVVLGKHSLFEDDIGVQSIEVSEVIIHDEFNSTWLDNDIALVKLKTGAVFSNYVQPACLWYDGLYDVYPTHDIIGSVVGWDIKRMDKSNKTLHVARIPRVPDMTCILYQPVFYHYLLNGKKFCAGQQYGTAPCSGDSGGAFMVYVEDYKSPQSFFESGQKGPGAWYVKGVVSVTLKTDHDGVVVCDPDGYTVFTDITVYRDWILQHM